MLDQADYKSKAMALLNDQDAYRVLQTDPVPKLASRLKSTLDRLKDEEKITPLEPLRAVPADAPLPRFYGLPKVHNVGIPLRPIVA